MKKSVQKKMAGRLMLLLLVSFIMSGCSQKSDDKGIDENNLSDNVILTETGDILEKESPEPIATVEPTAVPEVTTIDAELLVEPEQEQIVTDDDKIEHQEDRMQLVFLGDSIFDTYRDGTGVPYRTAVQCNANVYNLAIGGTCAAVERTEKTGWENWTSTSMMGVVHAISGHIPTDIFEGKVAKEILDDSSVDFTKTDYFIVEYGMNDFLSAVPLDGDGMYDVKTYVGALRCAVSALKEVAPDATIILCSPNYAQFYNDDWMIGDGNSINNGYGTLYDYVGKCEYVAGEQQVLFFDAYVNLGINGYTAEEYLEDGIHLTDKGRQLYADALAKMILSYEEEKNN